MSKMYTFLVVFLSVFVLGACSMSMPETKIYTLYLPCQMERGESEGAEDSASIAVTVNSPRYLAQPYIAYRNSPYQLTISKYSKWESSPEKIVKEKLICSLSSLGLFKEVRDSAIRPDGFFELKVNLRQFERADEGDGPFGVIVFDIFLYAPDDKRLFASTLTKKKELASENFVDLAKGLSSALAEGLEDVNFHIVGALKTK